MKAAICFLAAAVLALPFGRASGNPGQAQTEPLIPVAAGTEYRVTYSESVRLVNLSPVGRGDGRKQYGDHCRLDNQSRLQVVAVTGKPQRRRALVRVLAVPKKPSYSCPVGSLFFMKVAEIRQAIRVEMEERSRQRREKSLVRQLLRQAGQQGN